MSLDRKINRIQFLSGNSLKVIAVLTMLIDHLCKIVLQWLLSNYWGATPATSPRCLHGRAMALTAIPVPRWTKICAVGWKQS